MPETVQTKGHELKVFISYSRRDLDFADQLVTVLEWQGFKATIDRKGIHGAEKWEQRLGQLILEADIVGFVLSPDSAASEICAWEVEEAARRGKRIVPVLCRPLAGKQPHALLRDPNYIHFYPEQEVPGSGFGSGLLKLMDALTVDVAWLREHTRLEELAARWDGNDRAADLLVRGSELSAYKAWRDKRPTNAPDLTVLQRTCLAASEDDEKLRASAERKRLEDIAAAQADRQKAIEDREAALRNEAEAQKARSRAKRIIFWVLVAAVTIIVAGALRFATIQKGNAAEQERLTAEALQQKAAVDELIRRIRVGRFEPAGIEAMKKICNEAIKVTASLASAPSDHANEELFWQLFWGPMNIIEIRQKTEKYRGKSSEISSSPIESAMVDFSKALGEPAGLADAAKQVKDECNKYLQ